MSADRPGRFVVQSDDVNGVTLEHWQPEGAPATEPWCWWEARIPNGTTLPQLERLASEHLADAHPNADSPRNGRRS